MNIDSYQGYEYYITSLGNHPCAYIAIGEGDALNGKSVDELEQLPAHGCVNYVTTNLFDWVTGKWVIDWDYFHYSNYDIIYGEMKVMLDYNLKKWTTTEMSD